MPQRSGLVFGCGESEGEGIKEVEKGAYFVQSQCYKKRKKLFKQKHAVRSAHRLLPRIRQQKSGRTLSLMTG